MRSRLHFVFVLFVVLTALPSLVRAAQHCTSIEYDAERLACYDAYFRSTEENRALTTLDASTKESEFTVPPLEDRLPPEIDETGDLFAIRPHRPNYILPYTHNFDSDFEEYGAISRTFVDEEIKMQISLKTPLARDLWRGSSIWFAYTQQSYWQLYAEDFASAPFRETNYQPEVFWRIPIGREFLGWQTKEVNLGINHQSNGQTQRFSRSWNRVIGEAVFERGALEARVKAWHRIEEDEEDDDNPDIEDYMGRAQFGLSYERGKQTFSVNVINNLRSSDNRSGVELNWMFPLVQHVKGYVQYYTGYGENLFDAENYVNRIGIGFALNNGR